MTIERETLERAIDALECALGDSRPYIVKSREVSAALRAALAEQAEPVACEHMRARWNITFTSGTCMDCESTWSASKGWTTPPAPAAVSPLTDEQIQALALDNDIHHLPISMELASMFAKQFARAIERAHGIGDKT